MLGKEFVCVLYVAEAVVTRFSFNGQESVVSDISQRSQIFGVGNISLTERKLVLCGLSRLSVDVFDTVLCVSVNYKVCQARYGFHRVLSCNHDKVGRVKVDFYVRTISFFYYAFQL